MTSLLIEAGHSHSSIILRAVNSNTNILTRYHNLRGVKGLRQQHSLFKTNLEPENESVSKRTKLTDTSSTSVSAKLCASVKQTTDLDYEKSFGEADQNIFITEPSIIVANHITEGLPSTLPPFLNNISTNGTG